MIEQLNNEETARERHRKRIEQMRRSKRRQMLFRKFGPPVTGGIAAFLLVFWGIGIFRRPVENGEKRLDIHKQIQTADLEEKGDETPMSSQPSEAQMEGGEAVEADTLLAENMASAFIKAKTLPEVNNTLELLREIGSHKTYAAEPSENTLELEDKLASGDEFFSTYAVLIDLDSKSILAQKDYKERINPASMTKILTVLVAAEHVEDLDDTLTITLDITDYGYRHKCSSAGFDRDETVTVRDLFYGTILPSGADAAVGLATYVSGSQEAFVELMNEKLKELGLSETSHFTNCVGVFDEDHYSTVYDIAMILEAAMDNELCREFLSAHIYTTSKTKQHPEGIELSNWFLRRIEDKDSGGEVVYAKTGYVEQSGSCAASYAQGKDGKGYVCVTVNANSPWRCIYDHSGLYKQFLG